MVLILFDGWERFDYAAIIFLFIAIVFSFILAFEIFEKEKELDE